MAFFVEERIKVMNDIKYNFNFYYGNEAEQFNFYRIPKALFTDERFAKISVEAKVLYGLTLDRMCLSVKNGWLDEENRVYIYFKLEEVMEHLNVCLGLNGRNRQTLWGGCTAANPKTCC